MKPTIGSIVVTPAATQNGAPVSAAVVTRVWSDADPAAGAMVCINVMVLPDLGQPQGLGSIYLFETRAAAEAWRAKGGNNHCCWWPGQ